VLGNVISGAAEEVGQKARDLAKGVIEHPLQALQSATPLGAGAALITGAISSSTRIAVTAMASATVASGDESQRQFGKLLVNLVELALTVAPFAKGGKGSTSREALITEMELADELSWFQRQTANPTGVPRPPKIVTNRHGQLTNDLYTLDEAGMAPYKTGSLASGKSQWLSTVDAEKAVLDAAAVADRQQLWVGNKAKVPANMNVGALGSSGELTQWINVYRTKTGFVHGSPGTPR
jgi:hypothetical protein